MNPNLTPNIYNRGSNDSGLRNKTQSFFSLRLPALISPLSTVTKSQHHMTAVQRHPNERVMLEVPADITPGSRAAPRPRAGSRSAAAPAPGSGSSMSGGTRDPAPPPSCGICSGRKPCPGTPGTAPHQHARPKIIPPPTPPDSFGSPVRPKPCILQGVQQTRRP